MKKLLRVFVAVGLALGVFLLIGCGDDKGGGVGPTGGDGTTTGGTGGETTGGGTPPVGNDTDSTSLTPPPTGGVSAKGLELSGTSWKLNKLAVYKNYKTYAEVDYSERDVIFTFKEDGTVAVYGQPDEVFEFDNLTNGEHLYTFIKYGDERPCQTCVGTLANLWIDTPPREFVLNDNEEGCYSAYLNEDKTMTVSGNKWIGESRGAGSIGSDYRLNWVRTFTKING